MSGFVDPLAPEALFESEAAPAVTLADRFGVPPFSVLDRRAGLWQERKRAWLSLGIKSELGRDTNLLKRSGFTDDYFNGAGQFKHKRGSGPHPGGGGGGAWLGQKAGGGTASYDPKWGGGDGEAGDVETVGTSIFDPVLAELAVRWFSKVGWQVLDPFAGGSVRGIVSGVLGRDYLGVDLRADQVNANWQQIGLVPDGLPKPRWLAGDSLHVLPALTHFAADLILTCPPYADLEVYSDDPRDLSTMDYDMFLVVQQAILAEAVEHLRPNRFVVWVTSDVRDKAKVGSPYRALVADTIHAAQDCGLELYNDLVILDPVGSGAVRAGRHFSSARKVIRMHQHALVFVKGDPKVATDEMGTV